jgi:pimeloyl-ACP methyl ester carboxylesterase
MVLASKCTPARRRKRELPTWNREREAWRWPAGRSLVIAVALPAATISRREMDSSGPQTKRYKFFCPRGLLALGIGIGIGAVMNLLGFCTSLALAALAAFPASAKIEEFPPSFHTQMVKSGEAEIYVRVGGKGPAVVMLHGFADTGDMWAPLAKAMMADHTIIVPDLRGMGLSSHPASGYDKKTQGQDIAAVMDALKVEKADLVTHDIGNMVGYALAAQFPDRITKWVVIDAPLPGIGPWEEILKSPLLWHFNFRGPDVDRLVKGRERIYLDRFYNELSANPKAIDEATRQHYARLYARPGNMHYAFEQFATFNTKDAPDNRAFAARAKLTMPILALGAEKSFGEQQAVIMRDVGTNVEGGIITDSGHWIMEEQPAQTVKVVKTFLDKK